MKFTCTQENLNYGLDLVSHVASKNVTLPILNNILIKALSDRIEFMATNLEIGITSSIRGKTTKEGTYTVPARILHDFIGLLPHDNVELELSDKGLAVVSSNSKTLVKGVAAEEFPLIPKIEKKDGIRCQAGELRQALGQVIFAAAIDEMRPEISGVFFNIENDKLTLVATDSYRLAEKTLKCKNEKKETYSVIIPLNALHELMRILNEEEREVEIYRGENQILFIYNDVELISRLVEGNYPDYKQIIPKTSDAKAEFEVIEATNTVKAASLFCKPGINDVSIELKSSDKKIEVSASNSQAGESQSTIAANISGKDSSIVFNFRYLLDGLAALNSESAIIELTSSTSPGLLRSAKKDDYVYIIMPIRQ
ncbi:DNA polymerase III subunit beta [Patescibacteria group bacterium]